MILRKRAWDIMREEFATVDVTANLTDVMTILKEKLKDSPENHLVVVQTDTGQFRGVITAWDVLNATKDCVLHDEALGDAEEADWDAAFARASSMCSGIEVRKIMHAQAPQVKPNYPLLLVLESLVENKRNWAIVEEGGRAIGVILIGDLYLEISREVVKHKAD